MKIGDTILILPSCALQYMHMEELAGIKAKVVEVISHADQVRGCWVKLSGKYLGEDEWFIPYSSIGQ